jgi:hypothetical protein
MKKITELREIFTRVFSKLPEKEKQEIIASISWGLSSKPYSWRVAHLEIECETPTGERMLRQLEDRMIRRLEELK